MHPTLRSARLRRGAVIAAGGALALGLLPLTGVSAVSGDKVSFVSSTSLGASSGAIDGSGATALTAAGYRAFSLDASTDGSTAIYSLCHGTYAASGTTSSGQCVDKPNGSSYDATFGLVLVHKDSVGGVVRAKVLSTQWDANPVLTTTGGQTTAWFLVDGVLYSYAINDSGSWNINDATAVQRVATGLAPLKDGSGTPLETITGLAVSSDGTHAAATYLRPGFVSGRVKEVTVADGASVFQQTFSASRVVNKAFTVQPTSSTLVFQGSTLLFGEGQYAATGIPSGLKTFKATGATTASEVTTLAGLYGLRQTSSGPWWAWKDNGTKADLYEVSDAILLSTAPAARGTSADVSVSFGYTPSNVTPPKLSDVAAGASTLAVQAGHAFLSTAVKSVKFKGRAPIASQNFYWADLQNRTYDPKGANAAEVDKGTLQWSTNNVTWFSVATSGASAFAVGSKYYNGYTPVLRANTFLRWVYPGDTLTGPSTSATTVVTVVPTITVKIAKSGSRTRVSGTITAYPGAIGLYILRAGHWRSVASVNISKSATSIGTYTFGYRKLGHGTYKVANRGTTGVGYASGAKTFKL